MDEQKADKSATGYQSETQTKPNQTRPKPGCVALATGEADRVRCIDDGDGVGGGGSRVRELLAYTHIS